MLLTLSGRYTFVCASFMIASLSLSACAASSATKNEPAKDHGTTGGTAQKEVTHADPAGCSDSDEAADVEADARAALEADARAYAKDGGVPVDEAKRLLKLGGCSTDDVAKLERALRNKEADTFAGLWAKHPPVYGYVVLFTRNGEKTIRPYLQDEPERFRRLFEARSGADATAADLEAAQREVGRLFDHLKVAYAASGTNIKKNRVEVYVKDKAHFEAALREGGVRLPQHVVVVESELCCLRPG